jgi:hypothetical protein
MTKTPKLALVFLMAATGVAGAGGSDGSIGVGGEYQLNGIGGASFNYDGGKFHVGAFLGLNDPDGADNTDFTIGARFYYHVASTAMSDFSVGGSVGLLSDGIPPTGGIGDGTRNTNLYLEPGFQIRAFIASNVALSFTGGLVIRALDDSGVQFGAQANGIAGIHYYFFGQ